MSTNGPELRILLRLRYIVHSEEGHPWAEYLAGLIGGPGLYSEDALASLPGPEDFILRYFELASIFWARYGIRLEMHPDGITPLYSDYYYRMGSSSDNGFEIAGLEWQHNQSWINVFFVKSLGRATAQGRAKTSSLLNHHVLGCAILLADNPDEPTDYLGYALAHELGHIFGLAHPFAVSSVEKGSFWPFEDDTTVDEQGGSNNLMNYIETDDMPIYVLVSEAAFLTSNQIKRLYLTVLARKCNFHWLAEIYVDVFGSDDWERERTEVMSALEGDFDAVFEEFRQQYALFRPLPDFIPDFHAAWMG